MYYYDSIPANQNAGPGHHHETNTYPCEPILIIAPVTLFKTSTGWCM